MATRDKEMAEEVGQLRRMATRDKEMAEEVGQLRRMVDAQSSSAAEAASRLRSDLGTAKSRVDALERDFHRWVKLNGYSYINKESLASEMQLAKESGVVEQPRDTRLIVSLTSTPWRMYDIHYTLHSLLSQSLKPDKVVLWLGEELFPRGDADVPEAVLRLRERGLEIRYCHDMRSFTKLVPALAAFPGDNIVTADDDIFYPEDWLEGLVTRHESVPDLHITAALSRRLLLEDGLPAPYARWPIVGGGGLERGLVPLGVGGVLYPPGSMHPDVFDEEAFMALTPSADDLWFWAMALRNGTPILPGLAVVPEAEGELPRQHLKGMGLTFVNPERELGLSGEATLGGVNVHDKNSIFFGQLVEEWPELLTELRARQPHVSVVLVAHGVASKLRATVNSLLAQELNHLEILVVRVRTEKDSPGLDVLLEELARRDHRVRVLPTEDQGLTAQINQAVSEARGEYLAFVDEASTVDGRYLARLYFAACRGGHSVTRTLVTRTVGREILDNWANALIRELFASRQMLSPTETPLLVEGALYARSHFEAESAGSFDADLPWAQAALSWSVRSAQVEAFAAPITSVVYRQHEDGLLDPVLGSEGALADRIAGCREALQRVDEDSPEGEAVLAEWFRGVEAAARTLPGGWALPTIGEAVHDLREILGRRPQSGEGGAVEEQWYELAEASSAELYLSQRSAEELRVTVVVPFLNDETLIDEWVTSLAQQNMDVSRYRAIFVDRGSTDRSGAILEQIARESSHMRVLPALGGGNESWASAVSRGTRETCSPYVLVGDLRRLLDGRALRRLTNVASDKGYDVVLGVPRAKQPSLSESWDWRGVHAPTSVSSLDANRGLLFGASLGVITSVIRGELLQAVLEDLDDVAPDGQDLMAGVLRRAQGISYRKEVPVVSYSPGRDEVLTLDALERRLREFFSLRDLLAGHDGLSFWIDRSGEYVRRLFAWLREAPLPEEPGDSGSCSATLLKEFFEVCEELGISYELEAVEVALPRALQLRGLQMRSDEQTSTTGGSSA